MPIHDFHQTFNAGEISPLMGSRVGVEKYQAGVARMQNFIPLPQGPVMKRPGTIYVADSLSSANNARIVGFNFADDGYAVLELVNAQGRVWRSSTVSESAIVTPWQTDELYEIQFGQINNLVYAVQRAYGPRILTNPASGAMTIAAVDYGAAGNYPPLLDENITDITLSASATTGSGVTLTASSGVFNSENVGSYYELAHVRASGFAEVTLGDDAVKASLTVSITGQPADGDTLAIAGRTYTLRTGGRDAADEITVGDTNYDTVDDIVTTVNTGGGGAEAHKTVDVQVVGGIKATASITATTGAHFADGDEVSIGKIVYKMRTAAGKLASAPGAGGALDAAYEVRVGVSAFAVRHDLENLRRAINKLPRIYHTYGVAYSDYYVRGSAAGDDTEEHPEVEALPIEIAYGPTINATALTPNLEYEIVTVGTTTFANLDYGSVASVVGNRFVADGTNPNAGAGTGTAKLVIPTLPLRARSQGAGGNEIALTVTSATVDESGAALTGGTTVLKIQSLLAGTAANSYAITKGGAYTWITLPGAGTTENMAGGTTETANSASITVVGKYEVRSNGRWTGTLELQESRDGGSTWASIRAWTATQGDLNVSFEAEQLDATLMRLTFTGYGEKIDNVWPRAIIEPSDSFHRGLVLVTAYTSATQVTVTVQKTLASTAATKYWSESAWSNRRGFPRTVCFHQNRLWFAGSDYEPSKLWGSQLGDFNNFRYTSLDDGAVAFQMASDDLQDIVWLASAGGGIVIGTTSGEWTAREADGQTAITPTNPPLFRQQSGYGSERIQAVTVGDAVIFVEKYGRRVRRLAFDGQGGFSNTNLTVLAEHMTLGGITTLAVQKRPETVIWCGVGDQMICLTLEPEQNVFAWSRHLSPEMTFQSAAAVSGPSGEEIWFLSNVNLTARALLQTHIATLNRSGLQSNNIHTDSTIVKGPQAAFTTVTVPACMIGCPVYVKNAAGTVIEDTPASTTLTVASTTYCEVGIKINSWLVTNDLIYELKEGTSAGKAIRPVSVTMRVYVSQGGNVSAREYGDLTAMRPLVYPLATACYTGQIHQNFGDSITGPGVVSVEHDEAWPMTITGMIIRSDIGDKATHTTLEFAA